MSCTQHGRLTRQTARPSCQVTLFQMSHQGVAVNKLLAWPTRPTTPSVSPAAAGRVDCGESLSGRMEVFTESVNVAQHVSDLGCILDGENVDPGTLTSSHRRHGDSSDATPAHERTLETSVVYDCAEMQLPIAPKKAALTHPKKLAFDRDVQRIGFPPGREVVEDQVAEKAKE